MDFTFENCGLPTRAHYSDETVEEIFLPLLRHSLARVAAGEVLGWPEYDRTLHDPRDNATRVEGDIVLLEGNYLLLDQEGWRELRDYADFTVAVTAPEDMLRERLIQRHLDTGKSLEATLAMVDGSDLPNIRLCLEHTGAADLSLELRRDGSYTVKE